MSLASLLPIVILLLLFWLWLDGARAREMAVALSRALCDKRGVQLLDDSVALRRMALRRTDKGLRFRRMFSFEYSEEGMGRLVGYVLLLGNQVETSYFAEDLVEDSDDHHDDDDGDDDNVVPFRRQ